MEVRCLRVTDRNPGENRNREKRTLKKYVRCNEQIGFRRYIILLCPCVAIARSFGQKGNKHSSIDFEILHILYYTKYFIFLFYNILI